MRLSGRVLVAIPAFIAVMALLWLVGGWWRGGPLQSAHEFTVRDGSTLTSVAGDLSKAGAIGSSRDFLIRAKLLGSHDPVQAGDFKLPRHASEAGILDQLQHGKPIRRLVTIPEGMPSVMVYERLMAEPLLTGKIAIPAEGSILPDSYAYQRGDTRASVVKRMQDAMTKFLSVAWPQRKPTTVVTTPEQAVTLASIVEKETGKAGERRMVAGVLSNRLRIGMMLGADATTIYPITKGKPLGRMIRESELRDPNPYNTRAVAGLPPGPITNPGRESILAVLDPAPTKALYYVADGTGGHVFSDTLEEHNRNVAKWRAIRRARGE
ncbi:endolytic transglycosylase MltG [Porphyrobacter algicida]|uniref:Endolytic murein transglycosylase n=1 Tax=Qipengyuania algicida TaxID=1836209 RepID=A0A845ADL6_9SPHN|nr:endolytic transglycosylase MltG [Qipengyuania algicida]MXP27774.1 endolytic transglycosylase MltG [Qipengyuania algicida]